MKKILALSLMLASMGALAQDDVKYSLGLKNWNHTWAGTSRGTSNSANSGLVSGSVKYKDFSVTASSILQTSYSFASELNRDVRTDTDYGLGYTVMDRVTLLLGSKTVNMSGSGDSTGTFYGFSAFQPTHEEGYVYGTMTWCNALSNMDGGNGKFNLVDVGYGHVINKNTSLNIGYRQQIATTYLDQKLTFAGVTFGVGFNF